MHKIVLLDKFGGKEECVCQKRRFVGKLFSLSVSFCKIHGLAGKCPKVHLSPCSARKQENKNVARCSQSPKYRRKSLDTFSPLSHNLKRMNSSSARSLPKRGKYTKSFLHLQKRFVENFSTNSKILITFFNIFGVFFTFYNLIYIFSGVFGGYLKYFPNCFSRVSTRDRFLDSRE